jgi:predicted naringenin-chalcone synthase
MPRNEVDMLHHEARAALLSLGTAVPHYQIEQTAFTHWVAESFGNRPALNRMIRRLFEVSGIDTRYSCVPDFSGPFAQARFSIGGASKATASTAERMEIYRHEATALGAAAAQRALADHSPEQAFDATAITHLIVVSCTGFFAPGLDQAIANALGLRPTIERSLIGFMGCAAAFNGLRLARQIVCGQPDALVLVVCVELGTLHMQPENSRTNLVAASLFGDGAAACLVGTPRSDGHDCFQIDGFYSELVPDTTEEMAWSIGNHGFILHLSPDIPRHLGEVAPRALATLLDGRPTPRFWAIHPGGPAIVDRLAELFLLAPEHVAASLAVLRQYGNMSSPTILFVLDELRGQLRRAGGDTVPGVAMAFGPGLVVEMAHVTYMPPLARLPSRAAAEQRLQINEYVA